MTATKLAKNLKILFEKYNITPSQLSVACGIDQPRISRMMTGKTVNPNVNSLRPIAKFFDVTIDQLIGTTSLRTNETYGVVVPVNRLLVPIIEWKHAPYWLDIKEHFHPKKTIDARSNTSRDAYALIINDDSFEPQFNHGSIIIVDPNSQPKNKDYFITKNTSHAYTTIMQAITENNKIYLKPIGNKFNTNNINKKDQRYTNFGVIIELHIKMS